MNILRRLRRKNINKKIEIKHLHEKIKLNYGKMTDEYPEQIMSVKYIKPNNKVLEIGGNIGRNSLIISSLLKNQSNLVVMESSKQIAKKLQENKLLNNATFHIEESALSKKKIIQKDWNTMQSEILKTGYEWVDIITYEMLRNKYKINFDVLVLDCEGAFYYILLDMPEILNGIKTIIMENDYNNIEHKKYIDTVISQKGFKNVYRKSGGWGCCYDCFYEVWTM